jgi:hypothetical protein
LKTLDELYHDRDECEQLVEELEDEVDAIEDRSEIECQRWVEEQVGAAHEILQGHTTPESSPPGTCVPAVIRAALSAPVLSLLDTHDAIVRVYISTPGFGCLDWGPIVATAAKVCERLLAEFLEPRCRAIMCDPLLGRQYEALDLSTCVPETDRKWGIHHKLLKSLLGDLCSDREVHWSGVRTAAVGLLLFGSRFMGGEGSTAEIENPLGLFGRESDRAELRERLYAFQKCRNGFVHRDLADRAAAEEVIVAFHQCLHQMAFVLYGHAPPSQV